MNTSIACVVTNGGKVLIARRFPTGDMGGRWEFPGGKCEEGETCEAAIEREMREEFDVEAKVLEKITQGSFTHRDIPSALCAYHVIFNHDGLSKKYTLTEHSEYKWVDLPCIKTLNFVDSDLSIYDAVEKFLAALK